MQNVESSIIGKHRDPNLCEDMVFEGPNFIAVVDGATDKTGKTYDGVSGGRFASSIIVEAISRLPKASDAQAAVRFLSNALKRALPNFLRDKDGPSASVTMFSRLRREIWQVGDVSFSEIGSQLRPPTSKPIDKIASNIRAKASLALLASGVEFSKIQENDPGRKVILPLLKNQYHLRNHDSRWGFGAIDGNCVPRNKLGIFPIGEDARELAIYSDGYPKTYRTLIDAEVDLAHLLELDPLCIKELRGTKGWNPATQNSFDDRTYVRFLF